MLGELAGPGAPHGCALLSEAGFRRSLGFAYRPACPGCNACVAVRIPAADFTDDRKWRRVRRTNADVTTTPRPAVATAEQYAVFERYQQGRHAEGEMARMDFADFRTMVEVGTLGSQLVEDRKSVV